MFIGKVLIHEMLTGVRNDFANVFLDASTHLYMRVCPLVRLSVSPLRVFFESRNLSEKAIEMIESLSQSKYETKPLKNKLKQKFKN